MPSLLLLVDDDAELRSILEMALSGIAGIEVVSAASGEEALDVARSRPPAIVLTDFRMGGMTGLDLLASLRGEGCWPSRGAILMSGEDDDGLAKRAEAAGATLFWRKPVPTSKLRQTVRDMAAGSTHGG